MHLGFAKAHHENHNHRKSRRGFGLGKLPNIWGSRLIFLHRPHCPLRVSRASCITLFPVPVPLRCLFECVNNITSNTIFWECIPVTNHSTAKNIFPNLLLNNFFSCPCPLKPLSSMSKKITINVHSKRLLSVHFALMTHLWKLNSAKCKFQQAWCKIRRPTKIILSINTNQQYKLMVTIRTHCSTSIHTQTIIKFYLVSGAAPRFQKWGVQNTRKIISLPPNVGVRASKCQYWLQWNLLSGCRFNKHITSQPVKLHLNHKF